MLPRKPIACRKAERAFYIKNRIENIQSENGLLCYTVFVKLETIIVGDLVLKKLDLTSKFVN